MSYPRIVSRVLGSTWAITPAAYSAIIGALHQHIHAGGGERLERFPGAPSAFLETDDEQLDPRMEAMNVAAQGGVQVIFSSGIVGKHLSSLETMCGGLSVDALSAELRHAAADDSVRAIVLWLDTPGGVVTGLPEIAAQIRAIDAVKPVVAFTDSLCASAGYWMASACRAIYATPSADVGSIGVYCALIDYSAAYAKEGLKAEVFTTGAFKALGFPGTSLTDEQRVHLQQGVDATFALFSADVLARRPGVSKESMQGQCFMGAEALAAGLVDAVVADLAEVVADLAAAQKL